MIDDGLQAGEAPPRRGQILAGKYAVEHELGRGGMGVVVAARHLQTNGPVALKLLRGGGLASPRRAERLRREARAVCRLRGDHVARLFDVETPPDGAPFLVLERLIGEDLAASLKARGPLPASEAVDLLLQACEGLAEAHAAGIVHRDLKPDNLFLHRLPDGSISLKILDFGVSRLIAPDLDEATLTGSSGVIGTPPYLAPEQVRDPHGVDTSADLWSLGVVLFRLLTNRLPFLAAHPSGLLAAVVADPPSRLRELLPGAPAALDLAIASCLEKDPAARCPSVLALALQIAPEGSSSALASLRRIEALASAPAGAIEATIPTPEGGSTLDPSTADPLPDDNPLPAPLASGLVAQADPGLEGTGGDPAPLPSGPPPLAPLASPLAVNGASAAAVARSLSPAHPGPRGSSRAGWVAALLLALLALAARALSTSPASLAAPAPAAPLASVAPAASAAPAAASVAPGAGLRGASSGVAAMIAPPSISASAAPTSRVGDRAATPARSPAGASPRGGRPAAAQARPPVDDERAW